MSSSLYTRSMPRTSVIVPGGTAGGPTAPLHDMFIVAVLFVGGFCLFVRAKGDNLSPPSRQTVMSSPGNTGLSLA